MSDTPILRPGNDFSVAIGPFETVSDTAQKTPIVSGTISGFIAVAETPDQIAADPTLVMANLNYIGGQVRPAELGGGTWPLGWWMYKQDASVLIDALCETKFAARGEAFIHAISANNIRIVVRAVYQRSRIAVMA